MKSLILCLSLIWVLGCGVDEDVPGESATAEQVQANEEHLRAKNEAWATLHLNDADAMVRHFARNLIGSEPTIGNPGDSIDPLICGSGCDPIDPQAYAECIANECGGDGPGGGTGGGGGGGGGTGGGGDPYAVQEICGPTGSNGRRTCCHVYVYSGIIIQCWNEPPVYGCPHGGCPPPP